MIIKTAGKLDVSTPTDREIVMTREFDAPRALVFEALTTPALMKQWFKGPGWDLAVCEFDGRVGGKYRYVWKLGDSEMGMSGEIKEFRAPERMVATEKFDQAWYPGDAQSSIVLTEKGAKTLLTLCVVYDSKATRDMVLKSPMAEGVSASYDGLERFLATRRAGAKR
jgi:uncharacterized protein YndB with AHSA1/START domain